MESKLHRKVVQLINEDPRSQSKISLQTGIPVEWIQCLVLGKYRNPQVSRLETLYEKLSGKELIL